MPDLIDTHAHLDAGQFAADLPEVIARSRAAGVTRLIAVGTTAPSSANCARLAAEHEGIFATAGVHPNDSSSGSRVHLSRRWILLIAAPENEKPPSSGGGFHLR